MKKYLLSAAVIATFAFYSLLLRHHDQPVVLAPASSSKNATSSSSSSAAGNPPATASTTYKDGNYTGSVADAFYGNIQVAVNIQGGKIVSVKFLQYPNDRSNSVAINQQAMPYLQQEAIQAQGANVNIITGATDTSQAFIQSLSAALAQA